MLKSYIIEWFFLTCENQRSMISVIISTLEQSLMITAFVLFMMILIEYINVQSRNRWSDRLQKSSFIQIIIAALLGIIPGCLGTFTVVSLYTHRMIGFAGLVTVMIATSGDEAFVMFALFPGKALLLHAVLIFIALLSGWIVLGFVKNETKYPQNGFVIHDHEHCTCFSWKIIIPQLRAISFERGICMLFSVIFSVLLFSGVLSGTVWNWKKISFLTGSFFLLFVFITVPEHFLKEHLYNHVIKKHLLRIFLWTWGAFILLHFIQTNDLLNNVVLNKPYILLLIAVLIGFIPESGPHLVFVTMFSQQLLPFSILLANSIVQDGHGMLPLLAESRKDFIKVKAINMLIGLLAGFIVMYFER